MKTAFGWAIRQTDINNGRRALLGKLWWIDGMPKPLPEHMDGYVTMVFRTRKLARDALHKYKAKHFHSEWMRRHFRLTTVVKVRITIEEMT